MNVQEKGDAVTMSCDVLVLGGGLAGHVVALIASELGSTVTILEKTAEPGGSAVMSGGSFAFAGTDLQERQGIEDSPDALRQDMFSTGKNFNDPVMVDVYIREQLDAFEWLRGLGVSFDRVTLSSNQSRPRTHGTNAPRMFEAVRKAVLSKRAVTYVPNAPALRLMRNAGRVCGVRVAAGTEDKVFRAAKSVVIATGGFSRSDRLIRQFAPDLAPAAPLGGQGNTGDGIYMGMELGADLSDMGHVKGTFGTSLSGGGRPEKRLLLIALYRGAVVVNAEGERFADESISYKTIGDLCLKQPGAVSFQIFDSRIMAQSRADILVNDYRGALENGYIYEARTLEELARKAGIPAHRLVASIEAYNSDIRGGRDSRFGRSSLGNGVGEPVAIAAPPFYAFPCTTGLPSTYGGLRVDGNMRVLNVYEEPIPGLLAAGEVLGGFHGGGYISGASLAKTVISARVAGRTAAGANGR
jgi:fumarate reductase flavoprotein subunit